MVVPGTFQQRWLIVPISTSAFKMTSCPTFFVSSVKVDWSLIVTAEARKPFRGTHAENSDVLLFASVAVAVTERSPGPGGGKVRLKVTLPLVPVMTWAAPT